MTDGKHQFINTLNANRDTILLHNLILSLIGL